MSKSPKSILPVYSSHRPTPFDRHIQIADSDGLGLNDWLIAPCSQTRDSDVLARANFEAQKRVLEHTQATNGSADSEEEDYQIHRFGHWGPGWYEIALVRSGSPCAVEAARLADALASYPSLNDVLLSEMKWNEACDAWGPSDIRGALREAGCGSETIANLPAMDRDDAAFIREEWIRNFQANTETISDGSSTYFRLRWTRETMRDAAAWAIRWLRNSTRT